MLFLFNLLFSEILAFWFVVVGCAGGVVCGGCCGCGMWCCYFNSVGHLTFLVVNLVFLLGFICLRLVWFV